MAKSRSRVNYSNSTRSVRSDFYYASPPRLSPLTVFEDRRQFHPEGDYAPARSFNKSRHRLVVRPARAVAKASRSFKSPELFTPKFVTSSVYFDAPKRVLVCVRRKIRKQVMFALKKAGRAGQRRQRRNEFSDVYC